MKSQIGWISSIFLLLFSLALNLSFTESFHFGDYLLRSLGIPAWSNDAHSLGVHYTAFVGVLLIIVSWMGINWFGKRSYSIIRMFLYTILLGILLKPLLSVGYELWLSSYNDVRAIEYHVDQSLCSLKSIDQGDQTDSQPSNPNKLNCSFSFTNHSDRDLTFHVKLLRDDTVAAFRMMDYAGYVGQTEQFTVPANGRLSVTMNKTLPNSRTDITSSHIRWRPTIVIYDKKQTIDLKKRY